MLYPLTFRPIFKERLWGRRTLERLYGKVLPANLPIGESWEISDRPGDVSVIDRGPLAGRDLHELIESKGPALLGTVPLLGGRFPILAKILDAQDKLSLQVHPSDESVRELGGEPKTEIWYIARAQPGAELYVGLRAGVTRAEFESKLRTGTVADCFHRIPVRAGDAMFVPSGRVHGIGAGIVIFEIQQNSDTTYRVFDWNRVDRDGKPRPLHIPESLASIDFQDFEPCLVQTSWAGAADAETRELVSCPYFDVKVQRLARDARLRMGGVLQILAVVEGAVEVQNRWSVLRLAAGQFCLLPPSADEVELRGAPAGEFLVIDPR